MSLGLSIFLSTIIVCITTLYINTKTTWNWRAIVKWFFVFVASLVALLIIVGVALVCVNYYINLPKKMTEFDGIKLGQPKEEIYERYGHSPLDDLPSLGGSIGMYRIPNSTACVEFSTDNRVIVILDSSQNDWSPTTKADIRNKYGEPTIIKEPRKSNNPFADLQTPPVDTNLSDLLNYNLTEWKYPKYNQVFIFNNNIMFRHGIYDPKYVRVKK